VEAPTRKHRIDAIEIVDGTSIVSISGMLDNGAASELEELLLPLASRYGCRLVVDLGAVDSIDERAVGVIAAAAAQSRSHDGDLVIVVHEARPDIPGVGLAGLCPIEHTLQDGIARTIRSRVA
jgi:anti-anti-sigma factor